MFNAFAMVFLVEFAKSWRRKRRCLRFLVCVILISVVTKGTHVPLNCVVLNQTGELRYDYKSSVVENGWCLLFFISIELLHQILSYLYCCYLGEVKM